VVVVATASEVSIESCNVYANQAKKGGGLWMTKGSGMNPPIFVNISKSTFHDNVAEKGGGLYLVSGVLRVTESAFLSNTHSAQGGGGGVYQEDGTSEFDACRLNGNTASHGGGYYWEDGTAIFRDSALVGNTADYDGDAYYVKNGMPAGALTLVCTATTGAAPMFGYSVAITACSPTLPPTPPAPSSPPDPTPPSPPPTPPPLSPDPMPPSAPVLPASRVYIEAGGKIVISAGGKLELVAGEA